MHKDRAHGFKQTRKDVFARKEYHGPPFMVYVNFTGEVDVEAVVATVAIVLLGS